MATRHYCDVCEKETRLSSELFEVNKDVNGLGLSFDICLACSQKMFKPVKRFHSLCTVEIKWNDTKKEE